MAIKFVDKEPEDAGKPKWSEKADTPPRGLDTEALKERGGFTGPRLSVADLDHR